MSNDSTADLTELLLGYSLNLHAGEFVLISGPPVTKPLLEALFHGAISRRARPVIRLSRDLAIQHTLNSLGDDPQRYVNPLAVPDGTTIDCSIGIRADEQACSERNSPGTEIAEPLMERTADKEADRQSEFLRRAADGRLRWTVVFYPTAYSAAESGLSLTDFQQIVIRACMLDEENPTRCWEELHHRQLDLCRRLEQGARLRVKSPNGTDLTVDVSGRKWISCDGRFNLPDGEVFSAPCESSATGVFLPSFPIRHNGHVIRGIRIEFRDGVVVDAVAQSGEEQLVDLLGCDAGARRLGEIGIGTNNRIVHGTGFSLLDEKIAGTCHVAIGAAYPETGGLNVSAVHRDMIVDLRDGGEVLIDDQPLVEIRSFLKASGLPM